MAKKDSAQPSNADPAIAEQDILFECPSCGKSLIVDGSAEGMIIDCPRCDTNVIVPPRRATDQAGPARNETQTIPPPYLADAASAKAAEKPAEPTPSAASDATDSPGTTADEAGGAAAAPDTVVAELHDQLTNLAGKLREVQTQWADTTNRVATRINDVNRELVTLARLETSHKELLQQWNGLIGRLAQASDEITKPLPPPPKMK